MTLIFIFREASTSFGCDYDKGRNTALGELYGEVAYGILPELVSHVLKMDPQTDGLFICLHITMVTCASCLPQETLQRCTKWLSTYFAV